MNRPLAPAPSTTSSLDVLQRGPAASRPSRPARRHARLTVGLLLAGVLVVAYVALRDVVFPPRLVQVVPVVEANASSEGPRAAASVVEAQGWIEAAPYPTSVRPLVPGVIVSLDVVEEQDVVAGKTVLARLANVEFENEKQLADAELVARRAERDAREARRRVAASLREQLLDPRRMLAEAEGRLGMADAQVLAARARVSEAEAALAVAQVDLSAQVRLLAGGGAQPVARERAEAAVGQAQAAVEAAAYGVAAEEAARDAARLVLQVAQEAVADPRAAAGTLDEAAADWQAAVAAVGVAEARAAVADANLGRLVIRAPIDGRVMRLEAAPGALVGPMGDFKDMGEPSASGGLNRMTGTICVLYDPLRLQARIDVPLASLTGIRPGTPVDVESDLTRGRRWPGVVDRIVAEADLNKNTVQVKVRIDPPGPDVPSDVRLRPEGLCRAHFRVAGAAPLAAAAPASSSGAATAVGGAATWWVPVAAVAEGALFVHDPAARVARRIAVEVVETESERVRVRGPLGRSSKVVVDPTGLADGQRVAVAP